MELRVPRWLASGHVQTLAANLPLYAPPSGFKPGAEEKILCRIEGGSLIARAWWREGAHDTAVVLPGIGGSMDSVHVLRASVALHRAGFHVVQMNMRGVGEGAAHASTLYHAGLTSDLRALVTSLRSDPRVLRVFVLGTSLGGNIALKLASEGADVAAVASISAPLDLVEASRAIERTSAAPYRSVLLKRLVDNAVHFAKHKRVDYDVRAITRMRRIKDFDAAVVAPMHGFGGAHDYYARASSGPHLHKIDIPTLVVHAQDDPVVAERSVLPSLSSASPAVEIAMSQVGGHLGFLSAMAESAWVETWAIARVLAFFDSLRSWTSVDSVQHAGLRPLRFNRLRG
jgi:hypothetical protein